MPNDAAAKKAGPAEHGDGAIVRCHHDSNSPVLSKLSHACCRGILPGDALLPATAGDGRLWRKPNPATLSTCGQELQPGFSFLCPLRLRRGLAGISSPQGSIILRYGKTTPYTVLLGSLAVKMVQATLVAAIAVAVQFSPPVLLSAQESSRAALTIEIDGAIGPATVRYVKEALTAAGERRVDVVILLLNTPGGLATSMREIIADVLGSSVPVIGYVAPSGAHAASAGTYILYATHIAAMAPGTNLGAATPVQIGGPLPGLPGSTPDKDGKDKKDDAQQPASKDAMTAKATNDAVALIRSLAELRGRNADWAEKAVREAATLSASGALQAHVIDLVARNPTELLQLIDGRTVEPAGGDMRQLATKGLTIERLDPGWLIRLLSVITDPNVAFILLMVGIYGLIFEFST